MKVKMLLSRVFESWKHMLFFLMGFAVFSLLVSLFFIKRHYILAQIAIETSIFIHPLTKAVVEDTANKVTLSAERFLNRANRFFFLALFAFIGAISCSFGGLPLIWTGQFASAVMGLWIPFPLLIFVVVGLLALGLTFIIYDVYFNQLGRVEPQLRIKRKRQCSFCQQPFRKHVVEATNFLNDVELADFQKGKIQCILDPELCSSCSFPLTRQKLNLRTSPIRSDESSECPKCKNYTFTHINVSDPVRAKTIDDAGYKTVERQCHYCGYQVQRQPRISLSSLEPVIKSAIGDQSAYAYEQYCDKLKSEIEQMIQCDAAGKDRFKETYQLVDAGYLRDDGTPSLRELKYLSTDDRRKAIEFIHKYMQERHAREADPRNCNW
jgi:predicted nucleic-acid-binding Zn-ribbon protein